MLIRDLGFWFVEQAYVKMYSKFCDFFCSSNIWFLLFVTRKELWFEAVKNLDLHWISIFWASADAISLYAFLFW